MTVLKSNGPDCKRGPDCCCDPCYLIRVACTSLKCCRCIPKTLCLKFTPDNPVVCNTISILADFGGENAPYYDLSIDRYTVRVQLMWEGYPNEEECFWRVSVYEINPVNHAETLINETDYPIVYSHVTCDDPYAVAVGEAQTCQNPRFTITGLEELFHSCTGTFTIERYEQQRTPFRKVSFSPPTSEQSVSPSPCAGRLKVCSHICVRYYVGGEIVSRDFAWVEADGLWRRGDDTIGLTEDSYGRCVFVPSITGLGAIDPADLVVTTPIGVGMLFEVTSPHYLAISCNPCECWRRICGNCRCVCKTLCIGRSDGTIGGTVYEELAWDETLGGWGDESYFVSLEDDGNGGCQVRVPGYYDPFPVDSCGRGISFFSEQDINGVFVSGACKACTCGRPVGCCGAIPLPVVLYADVTSRPYTEYDTAHVYECFSALAVPLIYVPLGVEEDLRWQGHFTIVDDCGRTIYGTVRASCTGGNAGDDGAGTGGFTGIVRLQYTNDVGVIVSSETQFASIFVTDCTPLMVGDETWDDQGGTGDIDQIAIGCVECSYGISLRVSE